MLEATIMDVMTGFALLPLAAWLYLFLFRGRFWACQERLSTETEDRRIWPSVVAIVPARNEADVIQRTLPSLRKQDYPGPFQVIVVDDGSTDETARLAADANLAPGSRPIEVLNGEVPPHGWSGKVWAMEQAVAYVRRVLPQPRYLWFTDADIEHEPMVLRGLVQTAEHARLDMVSTMVLLHAERFWERLLIPAFVFFFQKLYPFSYVNTPGRATAAAAGGSMLVNRSALAKSGGLAEIRTALIDDCALARLLKTKGRLWLGLTTHSRSIRAYGFGDLWRMVTRTAYRQLNYSPALLLSTVIGMALIYIVPIVVMVLNWTAGYLLLAALGASTWMIMGIAYLPTVRLYKQPWLFSLSLPVAAILYTLMTVDSARKHWLGKGGEWKGRLHHESSRSKSGP